MHEKNPLSIVRRGVVQIKPAANEAVSSKESISGTLSFRVANLFIADYSSASLTLIRVPSHVYVYMYVTPFMVCVTS